MITLSTPNKSSRKGGEIKMLVIHGTGSLNEEGTISWIQDTTSRVSYHYVVGRDGEVVQLVPDEYKAWHAGESSWKDLGEPAHSSVNPWSIGIGVVNDGEHAYTRSQYLATAKLAWELCKKYDIPVHLIRGHNEVSPGRKTDPYDHWNWSHFFQLYCGLR